MGDDLHKSLVAGIRMTDAAYRRLIQTGDVSAWRGYGPRSACRFCRILGVTSDESHIDNDPESRCAECPCRGERDTHDIVTPCLASCGGHSTFSELYIAVTGAWPRAEERQVRRVQKAARDRLLWLRERWAANGFCLSLPDIPELGGLGNEH